MTNSIKKAQTTDFLERSTKVLAILSVILTSITLFFRAFEINLLQSFFGYNLVFLLPVLTVLFGSLTLRGWWRTLVLLTLPALLGFVFEYVGLETGIVFGGFYQYDDSFLKILTVPAAVILYWSVFFYVSYSFINTCSYWLGMRFPDQSHDRWWKILPYVALDGLLVVLIDVLMDPIMVEMGKWQWMPSSSVTWQGIPIGNYLGWLVLSVLVSLVIRSLDFMKPFSRPVTQITLWIQALGYLFFLVLLTVLALGSQLFVIVGVGLIMIFITVFVLIKSHGEFQKRIKN